MPRRITYALLGLCLGLLWAGNARSKTVSTELEKIKSAIEKERVKLESKTREQNKILDEIELIDRKVRFYNGKIGEIKREQTLIRVQIRGLEDEIEKIKARLENQRQLLSTRLRARYEMGEVGTLDVLFSSEAISDLVLRDEYLGRVYQMDQDLIKDYEQGLVELDERKKELSEKQVDLEANVEAAQWALSKLDEEKEGKSKLLDKVKQEKETHLSAIAELEDAEKDLENQIKKIQKPPKKRTGPEPERPELEVGPPLSKFCLPTNGRIEEKFGPRIDPNFGTKTTHKGVDIRASLGMPVRAVLGGQVVYADWFRGYGNLVILDHNNGYYSLYAHLDHIDKAAGDTVKKGAVLGSVGDTGSLNGAMLYFELRYHTQAVNPESYMDSSCVLSGGSSKNN